MRPTVGPGQGDAGRPGGGVNFRFELISCFVLHFGEKFWRKINTLNIKVLMHNKLSEARTQRLMILEKFPINLPNPGTAPFRGGGSSRVVLKIPGPSWQK